MMELQPDMQQSYFPGYYSNGDHRLNGGCTNRLSNLNYGVTNGYYYNGNIALPTMDQHFACKEVLKQIMLQHEATFQNQVLELHRLYNRQRELMDEANRRNIYNNHLRLETLQANPYLSQLSFKNPNKTCQASSFPWLNPDAVQENCRQVSNCDLQTKGPHKESFEFCEVNFKKVGKKILDLELPADEYIDSEEDESPVETRARSSEDDELPVPGDNNNQASCSGKTEGLADLNEPVKLEEETDVEYNCNRENISGIQVLPTEYTRIIKTHKDETGQSGSLLLDESTRKSPGENHGPERCKTDISTDSFSGKVDVTCEQHTKLVTDTPTDESSKRIQHFPGPARAPIVVQALPSSSFSNKRKFRKGLKANLNFQTSSDIRSCILDSADGLTKQVDLNCSEDDGPGINEKFSGFGFAFDLNSCVREIKSSPTSPLSMEIGPMEMPSSPESEENQNDTTSSEERIKIAANAIVSISSENYAFVKPIETPEFNFLRWLSRIASCVVDDTDSELGMGLSWREADICDGYCSDGIDYFEAMTLKLTDANFEDHYFSITENEEHPKREDSLPSLPSRVRTRRGRPQRKDFQSEILPNLASPSRQEVSKDLRAIGSLANQRNTKNGHLRGRRRRTRNSLSSSLNVEMENELSLKQTTLIGWGKITKRRRGLRCAASIPRFISGQT